MTESPRANRPYFDTTTSDLVKMITADWTSVHDLAAACPWTLEDHILPMVEELTARHIEGIRRVDQIINAEIARRDSSQPNTMTEPTGRPFEYLTDRSLFDTIERVLNLPVGRQLPEYLSALKDECHVRALVDYDADVHAEREFVTLDYLKLNQGLALTATLSKTWLTGRRARLMLTELRQRAIADCPYYVEQGDVDPVTGMALAEIRRDIIKVRSALGGEISEVQRASDTAWLNRLTAEESARRAIDDDADKELFKAVRFLVSVGIDTGTKYEKTLEFHGL